MHSFILLLVHALRPNDILERGHADTVANLAEIATAINSGEGRRLDYSQPSKTQESQNKFALRSSIRDKQKTRQRK